MKNLVFLPVFLLFLGCSPGNTKQFYFRSAGWKISLPVNLSIQDSSQLGDLVVMKDTGVFEPLLKEKILLQVSDSSNWRLNATYLSASITSMEDTQSWDEALQSMRAGMRRTSILTSPPETPVDSVFSKEMIDGKIFDKTWFKSVRPALTQNVIIFSRAINGYAFHCLIIYSDNAKGKMLLDLFKKSRFDK